MSYRTEWRLYCFPLVERGLGNAVEVKMTFEEGLMRKLGFNR